MKYVILHADGLADRPRQELGGKTPLQVAATPHLDRVVQGGELGLLSFTNGGGRHGSGLTGTAILGYDPKKYYQGPGPFEAASLEVNVTEHDVVYRCTMVTLKAEPGAKGTSTDIKKLGPQVVMDDATAGLITTEEARELIDAANEQLGSETIQFYPGSGHRHVMVWVNGKPRAVCTDPQTLVGRSIGEALPSGDGADFLRKLMEASLHIFRDHPVNQERRQSDRKPANCLWLWGEGRAVSWPSLAERFQISGVVVSSSDVHRGLGLFAGLTGVDPTRLAQSNLRTQATVALEELAKNDFAYVHVELPDEVVYGSDLKAKIQGIEAIDHDLIGPLVEGLKKLGPYRLVVFCDHGSVHTGQVGNEPGVFVYCDSALKGTSGAGKRLTEVDVQALGAVPKDATKFVARLFAKGS
jgi:2,3-bisphosphoglycerate-independent phosphoglycerate mutase